MPIAAPGPGYPVDMVRGADRRQAYSDADVIRLAYEGFRRADEPPPERGSFLPPPTTAPAPEPEPTAEVEPDPDATTTTARKRK